MPQTSIASNVLLLQFANIVSYILFLSSTLYVTSKHDAVSRNLESYIQPATWFYTTPLIVAILFVGLWVYQFYPSGERIVKESLRWNLPLVLCLYTVCSLLYTVDSDSLLIYVTAFLVLCLVAASISQLYGSVRMESEALNLADTLFVYLPVSLMHGFVVVMFFVGAFALVPRDAYSHKPSYLLDAILLVVLFFLQSSSAGYVFYGNRDIAGALVVSLGLLAIAQQQSNLRFIHWTAL